MTILSNSKKQPKDNINTSSTSGPPASGSSTPVVTQQQAPDETPNPSSNNNNNVDLLDNKNTNSETILSDTNQSTDTQRVLLVISSPNPNESLNSSANTSSLSENQENLKHDDLLKSSVAVTTSPTTMNNIAEVAAVHVAQPSSPTGSMPTTSKKASQSPSSIQNTGAKSNKNKRKIKNNQNSSALVQQPPQQRIRVNTKPLATNATHHTLDLQLQLNNQFIKNSSDDSELDLNESDSDLDMIRKQQQLFLHNQENTNTKRYNKHHHHNHHKSKGSKSKSTNSSSVMFKPSNIADPAAYDTYINGNNSEDEYEYNNPLRSNRASTSKSSASALPLVDNNNFNNTFNDDSFIHAETIEELEKKFSQLLKEKKGFIIKPMKEDGACLFRAVADQIYGDEEMHSTIRCHCMDYIAKNADYFKQYMTEDVERYISRKRQDNCFGNHIEIIAIAEIYNRPIEVYEYSCEPSNTFQGVFQTDNEPIRLSYHGRNHYNSVVDPFKATIGVGLGLPQLMPGSAEKNLMSEALKKSEEFQIEQAMLDDKLKATDWEATNEEIMELVARESYLQWLKDNEKRNCSPNSTSANRQQIQNSNNYLNFHQIQQDTNATCSTWDLEPMYQNQQQQQQHNSPHFRINSNRNRMTPPSPQHSKLTNKQSSSSSSPFSTKDDKLKSLSSMSNASPTSETNKNHMHMYDENMQYQYYESKSILNQLPPDLFGLTNTDDNLFNDQDASESDMLAKVLAASQQEYLESLKAKRHQQQNQH